MRIIPTITDVTDSRQKQLGNNFPSNRELFHFRAIYYDDRSIAPLPLKGPRLKKFYHAYRRLAELLQEPGRSVVGRLHPGDLVLFDNTRILHGRTALSNAGLHLQGCYLDADGLYSSLAVLTRATASH